MDTPKYLPLFNEIFYSIKDKNINLIKSFSHVDVIEFQPTKLFIAHYLIKNKNIENDAFFVCGITYKEDNFYFSSLTYDNLQFETFKMIDDIKKFYEAIINE